MRNGTPPRYQGRITSWKDEQGFGFITPNGGGSSVFVHVKSFADRGDRPAAGDIVTYRLSANDKGQPRAEDAAIVRPGTRRLHPRDAAPGSGPGSGPGNGSLVAAASFLCAVALAVRTDRLAAWVLGLYVGASIVTYLAYAIDKSAARDGRWRTQESTLHMLALAGGWPGALAAQRIYRHKTKKASFRAGFWFTVAANCALLGWVIAAR